MRKSPRVARGTLMGGGTTDVGAPWTDGPGHPVESRCACAIRLSWPVTQDNEQAITSQYDCRAFRPISAGPTH